MKQTIAFTLTIILLASVNAHAQFPIPVPKITLPKVEQLEGSDPAEKNKNDGRVDTLDESVSVKTKSGNSGEYNRQFVMDDGFTFFNAEPVKGRNPKNTGDIDIGWKLSAKLRLMGTFPQNSAFRVIVKKDNKEIGKFICSGDIYRKDTDPYLGNKPAPPLDDFLASSKCGDPAKPFTTLGWHDVEIYYIDGKTDQEKIARRHKIDVHKIEQMKGHPGNEYPGVAQYYVQRYAESPVGIMHAGSGDYRQIGPGVGLYDTYEPLRPSQLFIYLPISPSGSTSHNDYLRCSVNGQNLKLNEDGVGSRWNNQDSAWGEVGLGLRDAVKFTDSITFTTLNAKLPLSVGKLSNYKNVSENPGKWECRILENGALYRTIRFEVGSDGQIVPHPEQQNGNINLLGKTYLIEVEIPANSPIDERSKPMPGEGIFYGIPWTTAEGKAAAARVPKIGEAYPTLPGVIAR